MTGISKISLRQALGLIVLILSLEGETAHAIFNGAVVEKNDPIARSTVLTLFKHAAHGYMHYCSSTLIAKDIVVTSAHCFVDHDFPKNGAKLPRIIPVQDISIYFGNIPNIRKNIRSQISSAIPALDYRLNENYPLEFDVDLVPAGLTHDDIAVIKLKSPAPNGFDPVPPLEDPLAVTEESSVVVAGFGTNETDGDSEGTLRSTPTKVMAAEESGTHMVVFDMRNSGMAGGDSGGPAYITIDQRLYLLGVSSGYYRSGPFNQHDSTDDGFYEGPLFFCAAQPPRS